MVENAQQIADLNLDELKDFRTKSNWERYFSKVVACDDKYLDKRWTQLYDLRCMIAHNAIVTKNDYERIIQLVNDVSEYLQKAIDNLDKVHVPIEDKDRIAENVASNINALYGSFIQLWKAFETTLLKSSREPSNSIRPKSAGQILREFHASKLIDNELFNEGLELYSFRNRMIHEASASFSEHEISTNIIRLENYIRAIRRSWKDEVVNALQSLGGKATLAEIYIYIENNSNRELPETWQATVRYTLQIHSSDTDSYKGGEDIFRRLDRGYWGLRDYNNNVS